MRGRFEHLQANLGGVLAWREPRGKLLERVYVVAEVSKSVTELVRVVFKNF